MHSCCSPCCWGRLRPLLVFVIYYLHHLFQISFALLAFLLSSLLADHRSLPGGMTWVSPLKRRPLVVLTALHCCGFSVTFDVGHRITRWVPREYSGFLAYSSPSPLFNSSSISPWSSGDIIKFGVVTLSFACWISGRRCSEWPGSHLKFKFKCTIVVSLQWTHDCLGNKYVKTSRLQSYEDVKKNFASWRVPGWLS